MVLVAAFFAAFVRVGGDWDWLVALGDDIRAAMQVPDGVPFAASDTAGWHNVPVLAQLVASVVHDLGEQATVLAHVVVVVVTMYVLARTARSGGASDRYTAGALLALGAGALATLGIVRAQTLSLVPFALLLALIVEPGPSPGPTDLVGGPAHRGVGQPPRGRAAGGVRARRLPGRRTHPLGLLAGHGRRRVEPARAVRHAGAVAHPDRTTPRCSTTCRPSGARGCGPGPASTCPSTWSWSCPPPSSSCCSCAHVGEPWEYVAVLGLCLATASAARHGTWLLMLLVVLAGSGRAEARRGSRR